jgi:hypothetical protein
MRPRGTIKSRSPGSYRIRYSLGRDPVSGKRRFATATVRGTRKEAEQELVRLLRSVHTGEHVDPSRMTVGEWLGLWVNSTKYRRRHMSVTLRSFGVILSRPSAAFGYSASRPAIFSEGITTSPEAPPLAPVATSIAS